VVFAATVTAAVAGFAGPASADVQIQAGDFNQGDAAQFTFHVTNTNPNSKLTRVEMRIPEQYQIAEVYPMSAANWAPQQTMLPLDEPLTDRHGGEVNEIVTAITWWAMPGVELAPTAKDDLAVSLWTLPMTGRMEIGIVETFADGTTANSTATVAIGPPLPATDDENAAAGDEAADEADNPASNLWWMFGLLILIAAVTAFALFRQRRAEPAGDDDDDVPPAETVKAVKKTATPASPARKTASGTKTASGAKTASARTAKAPAKVAAKAAAKAAGRTPAKAADKRIRASH